MLLTKLIRRTHPSLWCVLGLLQVSACNMTSLDPVQQQAFNLQVQQVCSDLLPALNYYYPLATTEFALEHKLQKTQDTSLEQDNQSANQSANQSLSSPAKDNTQIDPFSMALQLAGAKVCSVASCDTKAVPLQYRTSMDKEQSFILLEILTPELTMQRLYTKQQGSFSAAGPITVNTNLVAHLP